LLLFRRMVAAIAATPAAPAAARSKTFLLM